MRVVLLEFNEITPRLFEPLIDSGELPNIARFRSESERFRTVAMDGIEYLEPWSQWVSVHTGVRPSQLGITSLGQASLAASHNIWDVLEESNRKSLILGSMNSASGNNPLTWIVPDPWDPDPSISPQQFAQFHSFVRSMVCHRLGKDEMQVLGIGDRISFLRFMRRHGLSWSTIAVLAKSSVTWRGSLSPRRAVVLDRLLTDLFFWAYRRLKPDFAVLFSNTVAYFQHNYWREHQPELFESRKAASKQSQSLVEFGYRQLDWQLGRLMSSRVLRDCCVIVCSGLSQQPCLKYEHAGGKKAFVPRDLSNLLAFIGVEKPLKFGSVMNPVFGLEFADEVTCGRAMSLMSRVLYEDSCVFHLEKLDSKSIELCVRRINDTDGLVELPNGDSIEFSRLFQDTGVITSGMHDPNGLMWIRTPTPSSHVHSEPIPVTAIAPTILSVLGEQVASWMDDAPSALSLSSGARDTCR